MKKGLASCFLLLGLLACMDIQEIKDPCMVYLKDGTSFEIMEDIRRSKETGVFTYRDEDGKLWSLDIKNEQSEIDSVVCVNRVYKKKVE
ncbi:hypothetical protein P872_16810 [Rhodonellum psychrophilum GCM71 = DSM 17998]|uniref:Uncharacterized protein n=2 Tax=Rhodonellum TaxID=336827 RepID=U5BZA4_9BACT|nr:MULTISPECIES: hypothetical protein [Rhodonellum]ERM83183.1 hypothetical protein P872_16810 [Rhodonellum psychrophilum GCM71 = DSM 17998]